MIYGNINSKHFEQELAILPRPLQNAIRILRITTWPITNQEDLIWILKVSLLFYRFWI